jgi:hypothetical protein
MNVQLLNNKLNKGSINMFFVKTTRGIIDYKS